MLVFLVVAVVEKRDGSCIGGPNAQLLWSGRWSGSTMACTLSNEKAKPLIENEVLDTKCDGRVCVLDLILLLSERSLCIMSKALAVGIVSLLALVSSHASGMLLRMLSKKHGSDFLGCLRIDVDRIVYHSPSPSNVPSADCFPFSFFVANVPPAS